MLRIVDDMNLQDNCNGIACYDCPFEHDGTCRLEKWLSNQPKFEDNSRLIPVANITFDEDKMREICEEIVSNYTIACPNCGTEIKPRLNGEHDY